jgi:hypothetical protein
METTVFKSRWGYHNINYQTFIKLKKLYKLYWEAIRQQARRNRWERKFPKNRNPIEPVFTKQQQQLLMYSKIKDDYINGKRPVSDPSLIPPRQMTDEKINEIFANTN